MGQNDKSLKQRNFLLDYLRDGNSNQISIYADCKRIKGSFSQDSLKNTFTGPLTDDQTGPLCWNAANYPI